jgi:hypothetical protein
MIYPVVYDPIIVSKVKTIDGRRWHPGEKHWSFPKSDGMPEKILKVFGDEDIQIDPCLKRPVPDLRTTSTYPLHEQGKESDIEGKW